MSVSAEPAAKKRRYLEFEMPLQELDQQIAQLKALTLQGRVNVSAEILALEKKSAQLLKEIFGELSPYQVVQMARHPDRPTALDYIGMIFDEFVPLHGDRLFMEDRSIVGGLAKLDDRSVMVVAHQKGRSTQENMQRNFGMPKPEGYRKALRLMTMAERFSIPLVALIDTPGAYPGIEAEERGQSVAIAQNILEMASLRIPTLGVILGEGGSGGALAIAVTDRLLMMRYSVYSVISPEGCAAITWKSAQYASKAAEALKLTAEEHLQSQVADEIVQEPLGGAHRDAFEAAQNLREALVRHLRELKALSIDQLLTARYERYRRIGRFQRLT